MDAHPNVFANGKTFSFASDPIRSQTLSDCAVWSLALACASVFCALLLPVFTPCVLIGVFSAWISVIVGCRAVCECRDDVSMKGYRIAISGVLIGYSAKVTWLTFIAATLFDFRTTLVTLTAGVLIGPLALVVVAPHLARRLVIVACVSAVVTAMLPVYVIESRECARRRECKNNLRRYAEKLRQQEAQEWRMQIRQRMLERDIDSADPPLD